MPREELGLVMEEAFYPGNLYETSKELAGDSLTLNI